VLREKYKIAAAKLAVFDGRTVHILSEDIAAACQAIADEELAEQKAEYELRFRDAKFDHAQEIAKVCIRENERVEAASKSPAKPIVELDVPE
jgi:hypothetical protein